MGGKDPSRPSTHMGVLLNMIGVPGQMVHHHGVRIQSVFALQCCAQRMDFCHSGEEGGSSHRNFSMQKRFASTGACIRGHNCRVPRNPPKPPSMRSAPSKCKFSSKSRRTEAATESSPLNLGAEQRRMGGPGGIGRW